MMCCCEHFWQCLVCSVLWWVAIFFFSFLQMVVVGGGGSRPFSAHFSPPSLSPHTSLSLAGSFLWAYRTKLLDRCELVSIILH